MNGIDGIHPWCGGRPSLPIAAIDRAIAAHCEDNGITDVYSREYARAEKAFRAGVKFTAEQYARMKIDEASNG